MKLTKDLIGKKLRKESWLPRTYFKLLAITSRGDLIGENPLGVPKEYNSGLAKQDDWLFYKEPKQEKLFAPALYYEVDGGQQRLKTDTYLWMTSALFSSRAEAEYYLSGHGKVVWPAIPNSEGFYEEVEITKELTDEAN